MKLNKFSLSFILATFATTSSVFACDLCAIHSSLDSIQPSPNTFHFSLAEQFTSYSRQQENGQYRPDQAHQHMESSITQIVTAYDVTERFGLQLNLPYINRRYQRYEDGEIENGTEAGIRDLSLIAKYRPLDIRDGEQIFILQVFAGLKFATGNSDALGAEGDEHIHESNQEEHDILEEDHAEDEHGAELEAHELRHAGHHHEDSQIVGSIHGHDLALGSGSYDFPIGINMFAEHGRAFISSSLQYTFRTEGDFDYEYGDDLLWDFGPGYYINLQHDSSIALKFNLSGEYKRKDKVGGETENDTGINAIFVGPELVFKSGNNWSADLAWDAPTNINNSGIQNVAEYRLRFALNYKF